MAAEWKSLKQIALKFWNTFVVTQAVTPYTDARITEIDVKGLSLTTCSGGPEKEMMTLQVARSENEEGSCVETNISQKDQTWQSTKQEGKQTINLGWLNYIEINQMMFY